MREQVRQFILENFLYTDDGSALRDDASFQESGIIDSTGIIELVEFLQDQFAVTIDDDDIVPENIDSVDAIVGFLQRKGCQA